MQDSCWVGLRERSNVMKHNIVRGAARFLGIQMRMTSRLEGTLDRDAFCDHDGKWHGWCPCCKRPVAVTFGASSASAPPAKRPARSKKAYVIVLWGTVPAYCLGA